MGKDGRLFIGNVRYLAGEPVSSGVVEMTSQGPHINGLDARKWISAGYACHIYGGKCRAYVRPVYEQKDDVSSPVVNITGGTTVGFRYLQFGANSPRTVTVVLGKAAVCKVNVRLDSYRGRIISTVDCGEDNAENTVKMNAGVIGKHAVYFEFMCDDDQTVTFDRFTFD